MAHLVNDGADAQAAELAVRAIDIDGTVLWSASVPADVEAGGSVEVLRSSLPSDVLAASTHAIVHATFGEASSLLLLCEPKDLALPQPTLRVTATPIDGGARFRLESDTLALSVQLALDGVDAAWSDNYVHVLPGEATEVDVIAEARPITDDLVSLLRWRSL